MIEQTLKPMPKEDQDKFDALPQELKDEFRLRFGHILSCGRKYVHIVSSSSLLQFLKEKSIC